ncbi:oligopeptide transport system permease protein AppB [Paenibacillus marchantiophytorum]|uniref:Oligopeptide transport system permease protein AppB n=1 Tax=Paenibacillus marchantiophytorum TaxID=1619310 RepID=A0ABQ2BQW9_9BACL|nr:ABC transporter permease [Paenibacillus marchantiophytorum]GGI45489.1 oligopeptide transport system permease protein AppB [Paenibacillus marchantiophytorum]
MAPYIVRRLLISLLVLLGITILNFIIINLAPGNPVELFIDPDTPRELIQARKELLGLNAPLFTQYIKWLGALLQGNLGYSFSSHAPVLHIIAERLGPTLLLAAASLLFGLLIAIPIGILSALKQNTKFDYLMTGFSFISVSVPQFFLSLTLIYVIAVKLHLLPTGGMVTLGYEGDLRDRLIHLVLPVLVLGSVVAGKKVRYIRSSMLEVLKQDYMRTAHAKGLHAFVVINKHALRNALVPIITVIAAEIPILLGGSIVIEQIFQWPGIGRLTFLSILSRDYPILMGLNLVAAIIVLLTNLLTDILYSLADPRIKYDS